MSNLRNNIKARLCEELFRATKHSQRGLLRPYGLAMTSRLRFKAKAQSTIEFTFAMIVIMFLIFGMVMVFRWAGMDLANRRVSQDSALTMDLSQVPNGDPSAQLNQEGNPVLPLAAIYTGSITNGNASQ